MTRHALHIDKMESSSQIIRMEDQSFTRRWFCGFEYRLVIETESTLKFISLDNTEEVFEMYPAPI